MALAPREVSLSRKESVDALRKKIDQIDEKVVALLNDRASLALKIGHSKRLNHEVIYAPSREQEVLRRVAQLSRGPLSQLAIRSVFREVTAEGRFFRGRGYLHPHRCQGKIRLRSHVASDSQHQRGFSGSEAGAGFFWRCADRKFNRRGSGANPGSARRV